MCIFILQEAKWRDTLAEGKKVQGDLRSANASLEGTVDDLQQELQREKVC